MGKNQATWGGGGTSGKRIPDSEDKPVSKRDHGRGALTGAGVGAAGSAAGLGAYGYAVNRTAGASRRTAAKEIAPGLARMATSRRGLGAAAILSSPAILAGTATGGLIGRKEKVGKALPGSALAHMTPQAATKPLKSMTPKVAALKPLTPKAPVAKAGRWHDPEDLRQRRIGGAEAAAAGGGALAIGSDLKRRPTERSKINRAKERDVTVRGKKWGTVKPIRSLKVTPRFAAGVAGLAAAGGIERYANSTAGRRYR